MLSTNLHSTKGNEARGPPGLGGPAGALHCICPWETELVGGSLLTPHTRLQSLPIASSPGLFSNLGSRKREAAPSNHLFTVSNTAHRSKTNGGRLGSTFLVNSSLVGLPTSSHGLKMPEVHWAVPCSTTPTHGAWPPPRLPQKTGLSCACSSCQENM